MTKWILLSGFIVFLAGCSMQPDSAYQSPKKPHGQLSEMASFSSTDYSTALADAILFYDANRCGPNTAVNNGFNWRGACHTSDGSDVGVDLTGGFHDAGDHVKFGITQGFAPALLGWSLYEFGDVFDQTGNRTKLLATLKLFTDYLLKCHSSSGKFYYQVGDGAIDHSYWGSPENQTGSRPTECCADSTHAASDVLGESSAALSLMYLLYKSIDATYAAKCLQASRDLYAMAKSNPGLSDGQTYYPSGSYGDDIAWAALWLGVIDGLSGYQADIDKYLAIGNIYGDNPAQDKWTISWDDMYLAVEVKMAQLTGQQKYSDSVNFNLNYWQSSMTTTPAGLKYLNNWGVLRYAAAESFLALLQYKNTGTSSYLNLAKSQINYILGNNPSGISYIIGFGSKWCQHPSHRAANPVGNNNAPALHVLTGGLVGGPDSSDNFVDDCAQYQYTEVAIDYNAGLVGALAGMLKYLNGSSSSSSQASSSSTAPLTIPGKIEAESYTAMYGIQTESCSDTGGGLDVGYNGAGTWETYSVNVASSGSYQIEFRLADYSTSGIFSFQCDGTTLANITAPVTGGWQTWTSIFATVSLTSGAHTLKIATTTAGYNLNWFNITSVALSSSLSSSSSVSSASTQAVPGKIEAESYTAMYGIQTESCSDTGGGLDVGWIDAGDWMDYNVSVTTAGNYTIDFRAASFSGGGVFDLKSGSTTLASGISVPSTGGWQTWTDVVKTVSLSAGTQTIRIAVTTGGFNMNWINITSAASSSSSSSSSAKSSSSSSSSSVSSSTSGQGTVSPSQIAASSYTQMSGVLTESCSEGGLDVGWIDSGDWMVYPITVSANGSYTIQFRIASPNSTGVISADLNAGTTQLGTVAIPNTGGWQVWTTVSMKVSLNAGNFNLGIKAATGGWNLEWIKIQ